MSANDFQIVFEDTHLIVLDKAAGLLSQGDSSGQNNLVEQLRVHFGRHYVGLVHRLDRNTSGLMVVAKRSKSADRLTQSLQKGLLHRKYNALLYGQLHGDKRWIHFLKKDSAKNRVQCFTESKEDTQKAVLQLRALKNFKEYTLCEIELETGRSHQIRVQAAHEGHPLLGDAKYAPLQVAQMAARQALHSSYLSFPHPMDAEKIMKFESQWPQDLNHLIDDR